MKRSKRIFKNFFLLGSFITALLIILISVSVYLWQITDEGRLPAKTAVVLHAINNNLVPLDGNIQIPNVISRESGTSSLVREDIYIPLGEDKEIPARVYYPKGDGPFPIIMYYHGGAFMKGYGDINTHNNIIRSLAAKTKSIVVAPSYRLAPDHVFPTAIEDGYNSFIWAVEAAEEFQGDVNNISIVGDSSGGNVATVVSMMARDREGPKIDSQVLLYPLTTFLDVELESRDVYDSGYYLLSRQVMYLARDMYTPEEIMWQNPYSSPLQAEDLSDLPPTLIITAEFDPLRDEGEAYAQRLAQFQVPVVATRYEGVMHGFISFYEIMTSGKHGLDQVSQFLKESHGEQLENDWIYELEVKSSPTGLDKIREQIEAYGIAAYLLGRTSINYLSP